MFLAEISRLIRKRSQRFESRPVDRRDRVESNDDAFLKCGAAKDAAGTAGRTAAFKEKTRVSNRTITLENTATALSGRQRSSPSALHAGGDMQVKIIKRLSAGV